MRMRVERKKMMSKELHCVELVGITMRVTNSGFVVIFVKDGSMESA